MLCLVRSAAFRSPGAIRTILLCRVCSGLYEVSKVERVGHRRRSRAHEHRRICVLSHGLTNRENARINARRRSSVVVDVHVVKRVCLCWSHTLEHRVCVCVWVNYMMYTHIIYIYTYIWAYDVYDSERK